MSDDFQHVHLLYGKEGATLRLPADATVLRGQKSPVIENPQLALRDALQDPIGCPPLAQMVAARKPRTVAIAIPDLTQPVVSPLLLPPLLETLNEAGVADSQIVVVIGTEMRGPTTPPQREILLGPELLRRVEVVDHRADLPDALVRVGNNAAVQVNRRFAQADFRIVAGGILASAPGGFTGGPAGVCPALADLATLERFYGHKTLASHSAAAGQLRGNPCHEIALQAARAAGVDFLLNVTLADEGNIAEIYCGRMEQAHYLGCETLADASAVVDSAYDLVVTCGGGYPLDRTLGQTIAALCLALPALNESTTLLAVSQCGEGLGPRPLEEWELQLQTRVLERIGVERLWLAADNISADVQRQLAVTPIPGDAPAPQRAQQAIDDFLARSPRARVAVIPGGPRTMLYE